VIIPSEKKKAAMLDCDYGSSMIQKSGCCLRRGLSPAIHKDDRKLFEQCALPGLAAGVTEAQIRAHARLRQPTGIRNQPAILVV